MEVKLIEDKWYIEVFTEDFGNILLLNPYTELAVPIQFDTEEEATEYLKHISEV